MMVFFLLAEDLTFPDGGRLSAKKGVPRLKIKSTPFLALKRPCNFAYYCPNDRLVVFNVGRQRLFPNQSFYG
jgi:hypothetical protein